MPLDDVAVLVLDGPDVAQGIRDHVLHDIVTLGGRSGAAQQQGRKNENRPEEPAETGEPPGPWFARLTLSGLRASDRLHVRGLLGHGMDSECSS